MSAWVELLVGCVTSGFAKTRNVRHGVHAADVGEEPVAEALAAARALGEPGDVHDVYGRVDLLGVSSTSSSRSRRGSGTATTPRSGLGRRERIGGRGGLRVGQRVEQGGLADVGQTDDAELHGRLPSLLVSRVSRRRDMVPAVASSLSSDTWSPHT